MKKLFSAINAAGMCLAPWMVAGAIATGLVLSTPVTGIAQQQTLAYSPEQQAALQEAEELNQQAFKLYQEGKYTNAIPLAERALIIFEKVLGKKHPHVATSLNNDDGVLTALEVVGLDLSSTELVVLSACDTGKGDVKVGDGVYGLRRALVIAGSQSQVLSLWQVDDAATKDLMVKYYNNLKAGKGRHEALRSAQLDLLNSQEYSKPYYWAAFVPSGNWTPLDGK